MITDQNIFFVPFDNNRTNRTVLISLLRQFPITGLSIILVSILSLIILGIGTPPCSAAEEILKNSSIIKLQSSDFGDAVIIEKIKTSKCDFDTSIDGLQQLKVAKVSNPVIAAMVATKSPASLPIDSTANNKAKEPEYVGVFFRLNPKDGELIPLEKQNTQMKSGAGGFLVIKGDTVAQIDGEKSPIRFNRGEKMEFVVKLASQQNDPQTQIGFASFESIKGKRRVVLAKATAAPFAVSTRETWQGKTVSYSADKYGNSSFKVSPIEQLLPGEYVLGIRGVAVSYCFGVDSGEAFSTISPTAEKSESSTESHAVSVKIQTKTTVRLVVDETLSSGTSKSGEPIKLLVAEDVKVAGNVVIAKGSPATGRITAVRKKSFPNSNGKLEFGVDSVRAIDGQNISLDGHVAEDGGGTSFGHTGKDVKFDKGYPITAVVNSEKEVRLP